jgi:RpiR family carbohydrate utilization transcriptional regulator
MISESLLRFCAFIPNFVEKMAYILYFYYMLRRIQQQTSDLSRAEQRVARWVLEHPRKAARATLAEVAKQCGTSEPTVIRFCRHVGLGGFRDFTIRLTETLSRPGSNVHTNVSAEDTAADAVSKVLDASIRSLIDMRSQLSSMPFEDALAAMVPARQLAFAGLGASGHVANDACHKFFRLGIPCTALTDPPSILQFAAIAETQDVLVITSHTGLWPELIRASEIARSRGATVIALTDPNSPLAAVCRIVFDCPALEDSSVYTPMSSRLAHLALLDALQVALALAMGSTAVDRLRRSKSALQERRFG